MFCVRYKTERSSAIAAVLAEIFPEFFLVLLLLLVTSYIQSFGQWDIG
jgi:hypothetical protein